MRTLLAQVLHDFGYQVCQAANRLERLERFRVQRVDLVISDLEVPEMNGLDLILELPRAFLDVKAIAMSGRSPEEFQKDKLVGAWQTFSKSLDLRALLYAVQHELKH